MPNALLGNRICVVGTSGSGKTYVARALAERLSLRYICNDEIIWRADWVPTPRRGHRYSIEVEIWSARSRLRTIASRSFLVS